MKNTHKNDIERKRYAIASFMDNVRKLDDTYHLRTHGTDPIDGTVRLVRSAAMSKNGKRLYSMSKSTLVPNRTYTYLGLKEKLAEALGC